MLDSSSSNTGGSRHLYSLGSHHQHDPTLDSIRNAIASDSQRIRVQDESTGQSYELQLGKDLAYPEPFTTNSDRSPPLPPSAVHDSPSSLSGLGVRNAVKNAVSSNSSNNNNNNNNNNSTSSRSRFHSTTNNNEAASQQQSASRNGTSNHNANSSTSSTASSLNNNNNNSASSSAAHKVLRLPLIVRNRNSVTSSPPNNNTNNADAKQYNPTNSPLAQQQRQFPTEAGDNDDVASVRSGDEQLQEFNRRYHESLKSSLAASNANALKRQTSRDSRASREKSPSSSSSARPLSATGSLPHPVSAATTTSNNNTSASAAGKSPTRALASPSSVYTAPPRHYPIMSELPPSPPLESDTDADGMFPPPDTDGSAAHHSTSSPTSSAHLNHHINGPQHGSSYSNSSSSKATPAGPSRLNYSRQASQASTSSTVYLSADESGLSTTSQSAQQTGAATDEDDDQFDSPTTPTYRNAANASPTPAFNILRGSPDRLSLSNDDPQVAEQALARVDSTSSAGTSKAVNATPAPAPALSTSQSLASTGLLHPASAQNGNAAPSRGQTSPKRAGPPLRRNTTGSSTGSVDSTGRSRPNSANNSAANANANANASGGWAGLRRGSRDRWMSSGVPRRDSTGGVEGGSITSGANKQGMVPSSSTTSGAGPLKTGDAGFDEEIAKHEALIRKRKERTRREEEEKAYAAQEAEKSEAMEREREHLREKEDKKTGGVPALMRAKSGLGKVGGVSGMPGGAQVSQATREQQEEEKALKGNIINENHVNYVLMYNMLTGIRIGVSRCQAKMRRPLQDEDYMARHKFTFDIIGNELTPSAKYDFKFKDYAPWVFRELREYFHLDPADYLLSLTAKYILSELGSPGKSGSFFYFSRDYRFIIKTIRHSEHKFLRKILKDYHEHVKANPHTLLSRFYGLHRVKLPHGRKIHFVIMNNLFPPHRDIHETYDLKGSSLGREYPEEKAKTKKGATLKDINWIRRRRELELGPQKRALFEAQLQSDVALLKRLNIMDYSLLIGLHDLKRGNSEGLRQEKLQVVQPEESGQNNGDGNGMVVSAVETSQQQQNGTANAQESVEGGMLSNASSPSGRPMALPRIEIPASPTSQVPPSMVRTGSTNTIDVRSDEEVFVDAPENSRSPTSPNGHHSLSQQQQQQQAGGVSGSNPPSGGKRVSEKDAFALRAAVRRSDPKALGSSSGAQLPIRETSEKRHFLFYQDEAGFRSTGPNNEPGDWIYYLGVIDLFTPYSSIKRGENWWKSLKGDSKTISSVPPKQYGNRFVAFLEAVIKPMQWNKLPPGFEKVKPMEGVQETSGGPTEQQHQQNGKAKE
ncbi:unnamed protein product [Sympodiomycopsis kandeliae]